MTHPDTRVPLARAAETRPRIDAGYGDDTALESYLAEQEGLLAWKAGHDEDAVQEARIAVWQTLAKHPDATRSYLDQAATWRIKSVLRGESLTGETRPHGGKDTRPDPLRTDWTTEDAAVEMAGPEHLDQIEVAYHHGEIMQAIAALPELYREYVVLRFWGDMDRHEIGRLLRRNPGNLATTWRTQIQPQLQQSLAHLIGV